MDEALFGRYRLFELIGEGGMGKVFKAHDTVIGRDVAIKVLPVELRATPGYEERFRREAHAAARLIEPHIIPIYDTGEIDGRLFLVMPVIDGVDLQSVLERDGLLSPPRAVRVIEQLAAALNVAHKHGLVHRDVKPSNALITSDEHVYLIDFGIAHDASATKLTQTGSVIGTFAYMAPERFRVGSADARADVYALACVLHECLTGSQPFPGRSMEQQIAGHLSLDPPKPTSLNPDVPAGFDDVIARGMAKKREERYQTATELAGAARQALTTEATNRTARTVREATPPSTQPATPAEPTIPAKLGIPPEPSRSPTHLRATGQRSAISPAKVSPNAFSRKPELPRAVRGRRWMIIAAVLMVLLILSGLAIARTVIYSNYYVADYKGTVSIMRGVQGSILGMPLHQPYSQGCLNNRNELSVIRYGQSGDTHTCQLMKLYDLAQSARAQVAAGLPAGTLEQANTQLRRLANESLPPCPPALAISPAMPGQPPTVTEIPPSSPQPGIECRELA